MKKSMTFYCLVSFQCTQDEKWGDWRPHLAMIISNASQKPELDRKAIATMGDTLNNRGDLFAAQFCYLIAKVEFGRYADVRPETAVIINNAANIVRLVLLGASCHKNFTEFSTDEAIIMTEIYEYACSLSNDNFSIVEFQPYKYLLGTRMLDYGFHLKTLMYMEQIAAHIQKNPTQYERNFIERVYTMADRLKFYDPRESIDTLNDDENGALASPTGHHNWQTDLLTLLGRTSQTYDLPVTQSQEPTSQNYDQNQIDREFAQINQQFSDLNLKYQNPPPSIDYSSMNYTPTLEAGAAVMQNYGEQEQISQQTNVYEEMAHQQQQQQQFYQPNMYQPTDYGQDTQQYLQPTSGEDYSAGNNYMSNEVN